MSRLVGISILVVDDESDMRAILRDNFEDEGAKVYEADGGHAALSLVTSAAIDVVVSDHNMAEGDGIGLLKNLRQMDPQTPVFFLYSGCIQLNRKTVIDLGARDLFAKPIDEESLISAIESSVRDRCR